MLEWLRAKLRIRREAWSRNWDLIDRLQRDLDSQKSNSHWEMEKRDAEIAALKAQIQFLCDSLELERSWVQKLTAQFTAEQVRAQMQRE